ncbi:hypothetical protein LP420_04070 [Massilia sp. B-10]|nr:hypothetical protein LP420_04070 [Massilia sp. B-10]
MLGQLRQQLIDALTQSGRFTVLDREFESELEGELELITSGKAVNQDFCQARPGAHGRPGLGRRG